LSRSRGFERPYVLNPGSKFEPSEKPEEKRLPNDVVVNVIIAVEQGIKSCGIKQVDLDLFREICGKCGPDNRWYNVIVCDNVIVDPLAFYLPYNYHLKRWGIYFRIKKMLQTFEKMIEIYGGYLDIKDLETALRVWMVFVAYVYFHELTHHIVEDISKLKNVTYPTLNKVEEEGLAEWHAFSTLTAEARTSLHYKPFGRLPLAKLGYRVRPPEKEFVEKVLSVIYYFMGRDVDPIYRPLVLGTTVQKLEPLWTPVREASIRGAYAYLVNGMEEVYHRVYLTRY